MRTRRRYVAAALLAAVLVTELAILGVKAARPAPDPLAGLHAVAGSLPEVVELGDTSLFRFYSPWLTCSALRLVFVESLGGAKVDVTGERGGTSVPLLRSQRIGTNTLVFAWRDAGYESILVEVHHHLRPAPALRSFDWFEP